MELDQFDITLLNALQKDNRLTGAQLAELTNLSAASCLRRVQRMRSEGVIIGDISIVSPDALPSSVVIIVLVTLEREHNELLEAFRQVVRNTPEIRQCYYVSGDVDFVLVLQLPSLEKYDEFIQHFFFENKNIKRFVSLISLNRIRFETSVAIPSLDEPAFA